MPIPLVGRLKKRARRRSHQDLHAPRRLFTSVRQVCTVVDDFEATITNLVEHLGLGPFKCWHFRPPVLHRRTFRGRPEPWTMKLGITWLGDVQWEVIQPMEGASLYREHLESRGRGVQHLLMATGDVRFEDASELLATRGLPLAQTAAVNPPLKIGAVTLPPPPKRVAAPINLQFGYIDAEATLRTSIELTRYPLVFSERAALRWGKAEFCIPAADDRFERSLPNRRLRRLVKVGIVTRDLESTARAYRDLAGVGPWRLFDRAAAHIGWALIDDILLEVVQPRSGASPYRDVLESRGEGVAYLGVSPREGYEDCLARCERIGYSRLAESGPCGDLRSVYLGARRWLGTDLELLATGGETMGSLFHRTRPDRVLDV